MKFLAAAILCHAGATLLVGTAQTDKLGPANELLGQGFCYLGLLALTTMVIADLSLKMKPSKDKEA